MWINKWAEELHKPREWNLFLESLDSFLLFIEVLSKKTQQHFWRVNPTKILFLPELWADSPSSSPKVHVFSVFPAGFFLGTSWRKEIQFQSYDNEEKAWATWPSPSSQSLSFSFATNGDKRDYINDDVFLKIIPIVGGILPLLNSHLGRNNLLESSSYQWLTLLLLSSLLKSLCDNFLMRRREKWIEGEPNIHICQAYTRNLQG